MNKTKNRICNGLFLSILICMTKLDTQAQKVDKDSAINFVRDFYSKYLLVFAASDFTKNRIDSLNFIRQRFCDESLLKKVPQAKLSDNDNDNLDPFIISYMEDSSALQNLVVSKNSKTSGHIEVSFFSSPTKLTPVQWIHHIDIGLRDDNRNYKIVSVNGYRQDPKSKKIYR